MGKEGGENERREGEWVSRLLVVCREEGEERVEGSGEGEEGGEDWGEALDVGLRQCGKLMGRGRENRERDRERYVVYFALGRRIGRKENRKKKKKKGNRRKREKKSSTRKKRKDERLA